MGDKDAVHAVISWIRKLRPSMDGKQQRQPRLPTTFHVAVIDMYSKMDMLKEAEHLYQEEKALGQGMSAKVKAAMAKAYASVGRHDLAAALFEEIFKVNPTTKDTESAIDGETYHLLAQAKAAQRDYASAIELLDRTRAPSLFQSTIIDRLMHFNTILRCLEEMSKRLGAISLNSTLTTVMNAAAVAGDITFVKAILKRLSNMGVPKDRFILTVEMKALFRSGDVDAALRLLTRMKESQHIKEQPDLVTYLTALSCMKKHAVDTAQVREWLRDGGYLATSPAAWGAAIGMGWVKTRFFLSRS